MKYMFESDEYEWIKEMQIESEILRGLDPSEDDASVIVNKAETLKVFEEFKKYEFKKLPSDIHIQIVDSDTVSNMDEHISFVDEFGDIHFLAIVPHVFYDNSIFIVSSRDAAYLFLRFSIEIYRCALLSAFSKKYYDKNYIENFEGVSSFVTREDLAYVDDVGVNDAIDFLRDHSANMEITNTSIDINSESVEKSVEYVEKSVENVESVETDIDTNDVFETGKQEGSSFRRNIIPFLFVAGLLLIGVILIIVMSSLPS